MRRIGVAIIDLICEDVVLILVRRPVIETHFRAKGSGVTAHIVRTEEIGGITLFCERMFLVHPQERIQVIVLVVDGWVTQFTVITHTSHTEKGYLAKHSKEFDFKNTYAAPRRARSLAADNALFR